MKMHKMFKKLFGAALAAALLVSGMAMPAFAAEDLWLGFDSEEDMSWFDKKEGNISWEDGRLKFTTTPNAWETAKVGSWHASWRNFALESKIQFVDSADGQQWPEIRYKIRSKWDDADNCYYSFVYSEVSSEEYGSIYGRICKAYKNAENEWQPKTITLYQPGTTTPAVCQFDEKLSRDAEHDFKIMCYGNADTGVYINAYIDGELVLQGYDHESCAYEYPDAADAELAKGVYTSGQFYMDFYDASGYMDDWRIFNLYQTQQLGEEDNWAVVDTVPDNVVTFSQDGAMLRDDAALTPGSDVEANIYLVNDTGEAMTRNLILGWYDAEGKLERVGISSLTLDGEDETIGLASAGLTLPEDLTGGRLRAFLWDGLSSMQPVINETPYGAAEASAE